MKKEKQKKIKLRKRALNEDMMKKNDLKSWRLNFEKHLNRRMPKAFATLRQKYRNTEFFLVRIFLYLDWTGRFTLRIQSDTGKNGPEITPYLDTSHSVQAIKTKSSEGKTLKVKN